MNALQTEALAGLTIRIEAQAPGLFYYRADMTTHGNAVFCAFDLRDRVGPAAFLCIVSEDGHIEGQCGKLAIRVRGQQ